MPDKIAVVMEFLGSLRSNSSVSPRIDLLTEDMTLTSSRGTVTGRDAAMKYLAGPTAFTFYQKGDWSEPKVDGDVIEVLAVPEPGAVGSTLRCHFTGDRISLLQDQALGRPAVEQKGIVLSAEMKAAINGAAANKSPIMLAYVDETGQPSLSFRGSTHAHSDDQLAMWLRKADGGLTDAIARNQKVALMFRDNVSGAMFHFHGRARITTDPKERQTIYDNSPENERNHDLDMKKGGAVIVDLDFLQGFVGRTPDGRSTGRIRMRR